MFQDISAPAQYLMISMAAFIATVAGLWLYNRREKRRKHAIELMNLMNQWGLAWFGGLFEDYAVGDYSGMAAKVKEIIHAVRSDEAIVAKLGEVAKKVATHYAANDAAKACELLDLLQAGKAGQATQSAAAKSTSATPAA